MEEIERIKHGESYRNMLRKREQIRALKEESKEIIFALKQLLDFKALANFFHINAKQMEIVKSHREDFYAHFIKDNVLINVLCLLRFYMLSKSSSIFIMYGLLYEKTRKNK